MRSGWTAERPARRDRTAAECSVTGLHGVRRSRLRLHRRVELPLRSAGLRRIRSFPSSRHRPPWADGGVCAQARSGRSGPLFWSPHRCLDGAPTSRWATRTARCTLRRYGATGAGRRARARIGPSKAPSSSPVSRNGLSTRRRDTAARVRETPGMTSVSLQFRRRGMIALLLMAQRRRHASTAWWFR